jgi:myo-inositol catabolism protein IolC
MPATNIRTLFLHPRPTHSLPDAATLLGMDVEELSGWVEAGEVEGVEAGGGVVVPWAELVSFAMDFWSQETVEAALGADVARVIPELVRLTELAVRIPRMEVVALERVAARDGRSVDSVLARELLDFVSAQSPWLGREVPGLMAALEWPETGEAR